MKIILKKLLKSLLGIFVGIFIILVLIEIVLRVFGWWEANKFNFYKPTVKNENEMVILALGDSMTALGGKNSYPAQLERILNSSNLSVKIRVVNKGLVRSNSSDIVFNMQDNIAKYNPDIVIVMTGINDSGNVLYENQAGISKGSFINNLKHMKLFKLVFYIIDSKYKKNNKWDFISIRDSILLKIGEVCAKKGDRQIGLNIFKKVIEMNPKNDDAYRLLGSNGYWTYSLDQRRGFCQKAISLNPEKDDNYFCIAEIYFYQKKFQEQIKVYKDRLKKRPESSSIIFEIAKYYYRESIYKEAERYLKLGIEKKDNQAIKNKMLEMLKSIYVKEGRLEEISLLNDGILKASKRTDININEIYKIVTEKNIPLVLIQYPLRDVNDLKVFLRDSKDAYFVDNNESFEKAVEQYGFDEVFVDAFAGDFGHGSALGNKIIAENVAKVILKEVLKAVK